MTDVPEQYQPEPVVAKAALYQAYWGDLLPTRAVADRFDIGRTTVRALFKRYGIPRRPTGYSRDNSVSPFRGFYGPGESAPFDDGGGYDPDFEPDTWADDVDWAAHYAGTEGETDD